MLGIAPLQRQPAVAAAAEATVVEDLLQGDRRHPPPIQGEQRFDAVAAVGTMRQRQLLNPRHCSCRRRLRVARLDRQRVLQPREAVRLEPPLPLVEAARVHAALPAGLRRVAQLGRQLQHPHPLPRQLRRRIRRSPFSSSLIPLYVL